MKDHTSTMHAEKTIQLSFKEVVNSRKKAILPMVTDIFISVLLYVSAVLTIQSMFELYHVSFFAIVPGIFLIIMMSYFGNDERMRSRITTIALILILVFLVIFNRMVWNGVFLFLNQFILIVGSHTELMINPFPIAIETSLHNRAISLFGGLLSVMAAYICSYTVRRSPKSLVWIFIVPLFSVQLFLGIAPAIYYNIALFFAGILLANYSFMNGPNNKLAGTSKNSMMIFSTSIVTVLFMLSFLLLNMLEPLSGYTKNTAVLSMKEGLTGMVEDFRYEKERTNTFTQGDFTELEELELTDKTALHVVMSKPTSLYLRGFIGSRYTSDAWKPLDYQVYTDSYALFYWLRKSQFNALNQLSAVHDLTSDPADKQEKNISMTINNISANSKYLYTPYELETNPGNFDNVKTLDDSMVISTSFFGERLYEYKSADNMIKNYPAVANDLYNLSKNKQTDNYFKNESYYNEYVYNNYLHIPKETKLVLQSHFEHLDDSKGNRMAYEEIMNQVKADVKNTLTYNIDANPLPESKDFIQYLLEESREGYATHHATLATLLFRSYGIPARYVEGYLITPEAVGNKEDYEEISVKGKDAHAWVEIYPDEVGWIPIEVTPPYYEVMEKTDLSNYPGSNSEPSDNRVVSGETNADGNTSGNSSEEKKQVKDDPPPPDHLLDSKSKEELSLFLTFIFGSIIIFLCLFIVYLIYWIKKRSILVKRILSFKDTNYSLSIPRMFAYSVSLLHYGGLSEKGRSLHNRINEIERLYGEDYAQTFKRVISINQECLYSNKVIEKEKYDQMKHFMNETLSKTIQSKSFIQRLKMKFWDVIY